MQKKFFGNLLFLLILNLLVKPFWILGIDRAVQNHVGYEAYGEYFALFNFSFLLNIFLDLGLTNYNNRNVAQSHVMFHKYLGTLLRLKLLLGLVYAVLTLIFGFALGYDSQAFELMALLALNQFLISFILFLRSNLSGLFMFRADSIMSVLDRVLLIAFVGFLLVYKNGDWLTIKTFILAQTLAYLTVVVVLLVLLFRIREQTYSSKIKSRFSIAVVKQSLPFALLVLLMTLYTKTDAVMLERMLPEGKLYTGIYAQGYRLLEALNMIAFLFSTLLLPTFSRMLKNNVSVASISLSSSKLLSVFSFGAALMACLFAKPIISALYPEAVARSFEIFPLLIICIIPISGTYVYGTLLTAAGSLKWLNIMAVGGLILNVVLNILLIPKYDVIGAVIATIVTQFVTFLAQIIISRQFHKLSSSLGVFAKQMAVVAVVGVVHWTLLSVINGWLLFAIDAILYVGISVGIKQVELKYFWQLLRSREQAV